MPCSGGFAITEKIGERGIFAPTLRPSPVQQLLKYDMGVANFYYFLDDYPEDLDRLISEMYRCRQKEYEYAARNLPFDVIIPVENTITKAPIYRTCVQPIALFTPGSTVLPRKIQSAFWAG